MRGLTHAWSTLEGVKHPGGGQVLQSHILKVERGGFGGLLQCKT